MQTDDRKAVLVGIALWLVALAVLLAPVIASGNAWLLCTCAVGLALGVAGLAYTHNRRKR